MSTGLLDLAETTLVVIADPQLHQVVGWRRDDLGPDHRVVPCGGLSLADLRQAVELLRHVCDGGQSGVA